MAFTSLGKVLKDFLGIRVGRTLGTMMKEVAVEAWKPNRRLLRSQGTRGDWVRGGHTYGTQQGGLEKAQDRCVGHGRAKDGFSRNRQVDGERGGTGPLELPLLNGRMGSERLGSKSQPRHWPATRGGPLLLSEPSFLIPKA